MCCSSPSFCSLYIIITQDHVTVCHHRRDSSTATVEFCRELLVLRVPKSLPIGAVSLFLLSLLNHFVDTNIYLNTFVFFYVNMQKSEVGQSISTS
jgi:hypothetical protein